MKALHDIITLLTEQPGKWKECSHYLTYGGTDGTISLMPTDSSLRIWIANEMSGLRVTFPVALGFGYYQKKSLHKAIQRWKEWKVSKVVDMARRCPTCKSLPHGGCP